MTPRFLLALSFAAGLQISTATAAPQSCVLPLPFGSAQTDVTLIGAPGSRCAFNSTREFGGRRWKVEILTPPKYGVTRIRSGKTKINPDAWIQEYTPNTNTALRDQWTYQTCGERTITDIVCETHTVHIELSKEAADRSKLICQAAKPVPVDFATNAAVTLTGPKGSDCFFWFPHAPTFWYDFPERPAHGTATYRRPNLFLYQPSSKEVENDRYRVRLCWEKERVNCTTLDVTVHYGPVARMR
jgi:hypothetical protein